MGRLAAGSVYLDDLKALSALKLRKRGEAQVETPAVELIHARGYVTECALHLLGHHIGAVGEYRALTVRAREDELELLPLMQHTFAVLSVAFEVNMGDTRCPRVVSNKLLQRTLAVSGDVWEVFKCYG